ncbi:MAG: hypothetical protein LC126_25435 [Bryobacterales bacterium]|nr:hypothetical protein [Bryobacterales bacterium]
MRLVQVAVEAALVLDVPRQGGETVPLKASPKLLAVTGGAPIEAHSRSMP